MKANENELKVLSAILVVAKTIGADNGIEYQNDELFEELSGEFTQSQVKGYISSLESKGFIELYNTYYDGEITASGQQEVANSKVINNNKSNNKIVNQMNNQEINPVMDSGIVRMNEIKAIKLSSISQKKRLLIKEAKAAIPFIIENWSNVKVLSKMTQDDEFTSTQSELTEIVKGRIEELSAPAHEEIANEPAKTEDKESKVTSSDKKKAPKNARKIGDVHPKHSNWIWTEYAEGKFDWRTNPAEKKQGQRNDRPKADFSPKPKTASPTKQKAASSTKPKQSKVKPLKVSKQETKRVLGMCKWKTNIAPGGFPSSAEIVLDEKKIKLWLKKTDKIKNTDLSKCRERVGTFVINYKSVFGELPYRFIHEQNFSSFGLTEQDVEDIKSTIKDKEIETTQSYF